MTPQSIFRVRVFIDPAVVFVAARYAVLEDIDFIRDTWGYDIENRVVFSWELVDEGDENEYDDDDGGGGDGAETVVVSTCRTLAFFFGDLKTFQHDSI